MLKNHAHVQKKTRNEGGSEEDRKSRKLEVDSTIGFVSKIADLRLPVYPGCQSRNVRFKGYKTYLGEILGRQ